MISNPFRIFRSFGSIICLEFFSKNDPFSNLKDLERKIGTGRIVGLKQVHGSKTVRVSSPSWKTIEADAAFTDTKDLFLTVTFADCQNLIVYAPGQSVIGVVHAGWRGLIRGMVPAAIDFLCQEWDVLPGEILIGAGPSLCAKCSDFSDPKKEVPELGEYIAGRTVDLRQALEDQLWERGILKNNFERMSGCTRCHPERYWTYRGGDREKVINGFTNCLAVKLI